MPKHFIEACWNASQGHNFKQKSSHAKIYHAVWGGLGSGMQPPPLAGRVRAMPRDSEEAGLLCHGVSLEHLCPLGYGASDLHYKTWNLLHTICMETGSWATLAQTAAERAMHHD